MCHKRDGWVLIAEEWGSMWKGCEEVRGRRSSRRRGWGAGSRRVRKRKRRWKGSRRRCESSFEWKKEEERERERGGGGGEKREKRVEGMAISGWGLLELCIR